MLQFEYLKVFFIFLQWEWSWCSFSSASVVKDFLTLRMNFLLRVKCFFRTDAQCNFTTLVKWSLFRMCRQRLRFLRFVYLLISSRFYHRWRASSQRGSSDLIYMCIWAGDRFFGFWFSFLRSKRNIKSCEFSNEKESEA